MSQVSSAAVSAVRSTAPAAVSSLSIPKHLCVRFTTVSDMSRVMALFDGERKAQMDPKGKVRKRSAQDLTSPVATGSAVIALDERENIRFFGMASDHYNVQGKPNSVTELGAILCDVPGYKLAQLGSAMLALSEAIRLRESAPCFSSKGVHALVARDNGPANKIFGKELAWQDVPLEDHREELFRTQNKHSCPDARASRVWYEFGKSARDAARNVITKPLASGQLTSKQGGRIDVDLDHHVIQLV